MNAKKYLLDIGFDDNDLPWLFNNDDKSNYTVDELMESYHQAKLKLLDIPIVVVNEVELRSSCEWCNGDNRPNKRPKVTSTLIK